MNSLNSSFKCRIHDCENEVKDEGMICAECEQQQGEYFTELARDLQISKSLWESYQI